MTKYIHPDETLNIYYRVSEDTNELEDIVKIERNDDKKEISDIPDLQNTKIIQWSPDSEHEDEEFTFDIDGFGTQKIRVANIPEGGVWNWDNGENGSDDEHWVFDDNSNNNYTTSQVLSGSHSIQNIGSDGDGWLYMNEDIFADIYTANNFVHEFYISDSGTDVGQSNPFNFSFYDEIIDNMGGSGGVINVFFRNGEDIRLSAKDVGNAQKTIGYPNNSFLRVVLSYDLENNNLDMDVYSKENNKWNNFEGGVSLNISDRTWSFEDLITVRLMGNEDGDSSTGDYYIDHLRLSTEPSEKPIV